MSYEEILKKARLLRRELGEAMKELHIDPISEPNHPLCKQFQHAAEIELEAMKELGQ